MEGEENERAAVDAGVAVDGAVRSSRRDPSPVRAAAFAVELLLPTFLIVDNAACMVVMILERLVGSSCYGRILSFGSIRATQEIVYYVVFRTIESHKGVCLCSPFAAGFLLQRSLRCLPGFCGWEEAPTLRFTCLDTSPIENEKVSPLHYVMFFFMRYKMVLKN